MPHCNLRSMTGYGRAQSQSSMGQFSVELRSVNNRFADISVSLPREFNALETPLRKHLQGAISRGKIDCRVRHVPAADRQQAVTINTALAREYIARLRELSDAGASEEISIATLTALPGVVEVGSAEVDQDEAWAELRPVVEDAIARHRAEREREGRAMAEQMWQLGEEIRALRDRADEIKDQVTEKYRARLSERVAQLEEELKARLEPGRLEMEVAMVADKSDVTEELIRLAAHLERYEEMLLNTADEPVGKNLDFLIQEFVREINTLCSKARDTDMTALGLAMKTATEKIREQVQNIE